MSDIDTCPFCKIIVKVCDTAMCCDLCNNGFMSKGIILMI